MRTLKKTLCLVLALVMMLGLCAINVGATAFTDDDEIAADYQEAVEVATGIGVINGKGDGSTFDPKGTLTRVQGCYLITNLLDADLGATATRFMDVNKEDVAVVEWMAANGIADGRDDTTFDPSSTMTGKEFAKWLLTSLGFNADKENLTGPNWEGGVRILTARMGLSKGIEAYDQNKALTREEAAQMCLNALEATMYYYPSTTTVVGGGVNVSVSDAAARLPNNNGTDYWDDSARNAAGRADRQAFVQLVEMYHPQLKKVSSSTTTSKEELNRPMDHIWKLNGKELYRVVAAPKAVYTSKQADTKNIVNDLSDCYIYVAANDLLYVNGVEKTGKTSSDSILYVNGAAADSIKGKDAGKYSFDNSGNSQADKITLSGISVADMIKDITENGRVVEVYADEDGKITQIIVTVCTVAKVSNVTTNKGETTYTFAGAQTGATISGVSAKTYDDASKENTLITDAALAKGDIVLLTSNAYDTALTAPTGENKLYAYLAEKHTGTQSSYSTSNKTASIDGTNYPIATGVVKNTTPTKLANDEFKANKEIDYYLFNLGGVDYLVHTSAVVDNSTTGNYAFIIGAVGEIKPSKFDENDKTSEIKVLAVLSDGTCGEYTVATKNVKAADKTDVYVPSSTANEYKIKTDLSNDYVVIENTKIMVGGTDITWGTGSEDVKVDNAAKILMSDLYGYVYEYTLNGSTITLKPLGDKEATDTSDRYGNNYYGGTCKVEGKTYAGQTTTPVIAGKQNYLSAYMAKSSEITGGGDIKGAYGNTPIGETASVPGSDPNTVVIGSSTTVIKYDSSKKEAKVETGISNLPTSGSVVGYYVAEATANNRLNAKVVFLAKSGEIKATAGPSKEYVFIKGGDPVRTEKNENDTINYYNAWRAGNTESFEVQVKASKMGTVNTGLYLLKGDEIDTAKLTTATSGTISADAPYFRVVASQGVNNVTTENMISSGSFTTAAGGNLWNLGDVTPTNGGDINTKDLYVILKLNSANELTEEIEAVFTV